MRHIVSKIVSGLALVVLLALSAQASFGQSPSGADVVMVLPFENTSNRPEYNWVGESFADSIAELLNKPGLLVVSCRDGQRASRDNGRSAATNAAVAGRSARVVIGAW